MVRTGNRTLPCAMRRLCVFLLLGFVSLFSPYYCLLIRLIVNIGLTRTGDPVCGRVLQHAIAYAAFIQERAGFDTCTAQLLIGIVNLLVRRLGSTNYHNALPRECVYCSATIPKMLSKSYDISVIQ